MSTSLYRTTKTRNARTQEQLKSGLLVHKQFARKRCREASDHNTYGVELPRCSQAILEPVILSLTGGTSEVCAERRSCHTVGIFMEDTATVYRCCFIQPELSSVTCSFPGNWKELVRNTLSIVANRYPDAVACTLSTAVKHPQLSGRMVPYVVDELPFPVSWGFANISCSYMLFIRTDESTGQTILALSKDSMSILKSHFPSYSACIYDVRTSSYKITVKPDISVNMNDANKNTCMYVYGDGSFRLQGKPAVMAKVCSSFKDAIISVSESKSWSSFTSQLVEIEQ